MIEWLTVILLAMTPIGELRAAIPAGIVMGLNPVAVFYISVLFNILVFFPIYFGLKWFYEHIKGFKLVRHVIESVRKRESGILKKYGYFGLVIFVGIPFPLTGAWSGTIIAWLFNLDWRKSCTAISIGVLIAGIIILSGTIGGIKLFGG
jgi:uncharacterized membrane protein